MALTLAVCVSTDPPRVVHLFVPDPDLDHVCSVCGEVDNEDRDGFDVAEADGGWTDDTSFGYRDVLRMGPKTDDIDTGHPLAYGEAGD